MTDRDPQEEEEKEEVPSPRLRPPSSVLTKLRGGGGGEGGGGGDDDRPGFYRCNTVSVPTSKVAAVDFRKRCFSVEGGRRRRRKEEEEEEEGVDMATMMRKRTSSVSRPSPTIPPAFGLGDSIVKSAEKLGRIHRQNAKKNTVESLFLRILILRISIFFTGCILLLRG